MDTGLKAQVVVVTGGAKGIGRAAVKLFASQGAQVVLVDKDAAAGNSLEIELLNEGAEAFFIEADLTSAGSCEKIIDAVIQRYGRLDVLVNNAGVNDHKGLNASTEEFLDSLRLNLVHYFELTKFAAPYLRKSKGKIINIASKVAQTGQGDTSGYAAAKGGVLALTREWAVDFAQSGVTVNAVVPAEVYTPMYEHELSRQPDPVAAKKAIESLIPLGNRMTAPEEIANTVVFLGSQLSNHITGQFIFVDGGYTHLDRAYRRD